MTEKQSKTSGFRPPDICIAGFAKSGTSSLAQMLCSHSEIDFHVVGVKEPHTFAIDSRYNERENYSSSSAPYLLDASTTFATSELALNRLCADNPNCKIIFVLRDPVDRILSHYNWYSKKAGRLLPLAKELQLEKGKKWDVNDHANFNYKFFVQSTLYGSRIQQARELFPEVLILYFSDFRNNAEKLKLECLDFLGIQPDEKMISIPHENSTKAIDKNEIEHPLRKALFRVRNLGRTINNFRDFYVVSFLRYGSFSKTRKELIPSSELTALIVPYLTEEIEIMIKEGIDLKKFQTLFNFLQSRPR